jgi:CDP-diacylglycerol--glycerol-3-phosphate 3-phosphatidyltransferase
MNLANKLTMSRIVMTIFIIILLLFPFYEIGFNFPKYTVDGNIVIDLKILIAGILFIIASLTDFLDGYIARKYNMISDTGKILDAIADKILVNSTLIIFASIGMIAPVIPVVVVLRDVVVDAIKMMAAKRGEAVAAIKSGKLKTACLMFGIVLTYFYNLPFALWNLQVSEYLLLIATMLSLFSMYQYYEKYKIKK